MKKKRNSIKSLEMRTEYRYWKEHSLNTTGYFIIFQGFMEENLLKDISGNALKLYIYLGINSNNMEGIVWHSNKTIAEYFDKSERTIRLWMKELEDRGLIKRMRLVYDGNVYTYLKPYKNIKGLTRRLLYGSLFFNKEGELHFRYLNVEYKLNKDIYECVLVFKEKGEVSGMLKRDFQEAYYTFKSYDEKISIKLDYSKMGDVAIKAAVKLES